MMSKEELLWKLEKNQSFSGENKSVYLNVTLWEIIDDIIKLSNNKFSSKNHFIRCAVNKLIREELNTKEAIIDE